MNRFLLFLLIGMLLSAQQSRASCVEKFEKAAVEADQDWNRMTKAKPGGDLWNFIKNPKAYLNAGHKSDQLGYAAVIFKGFRAGINTNGAHAIYSMTVDKKAAGNSVDMSPSSQSTMFLMTALHHANVPATGNDLAIALQVANELDRSEAVCSADELKNGVDIDAIQRRIGAEVARRVALDRKSTKNLNALSGSIDCKKVAGSEAELGSKVFSGIVSCQEANLEYSAYVTCVLDGNSDPNWNKCWEDARNGSTQATRTFVPSDNRNLPAGSNR